jgi:hypothetical protein
MADLQTAAASNYQVEVVVDVTSLVGLWDALAFQPVDPPIQQHVLPILLPEIEQKLQTLLSPWLALRHQLLQRRASQ